MIDFFLIDLVSENYFFLPTFDNEKFQTYSYELEEWPRNLPPALARLDSGLHCCHVCCIAFSLYLFFVLYWGKKKKIREYVADMTVQPRAF